MKEVDVAEIESTASKQYNHQKFLESLHESMSSSSREYLAKKMPKVREITYESSVEYSKESQGQLLTESAHQHFSEDRAIEDYSKVSATRIVEWAKKKKSVVINEGADSQAKLKTFKDSPPRSQRGGREINFHERVNMVTV